MFQPLNPLEEVDLQEFQLWAATFDGPDTDRLFELFATLAALSKEKARVLDEIHQSMPFQSRAMMPGRPIESRATGKVIPWPSKPLLKKRKKAAYK